MDFGSSKRSSRSGEARRADAGRRWFRWSKDGHRVFIERDAGADAGFRDEHYEQAGARIVYSAQEAYGRADVVLKVARPTAAEHELFRHGQVIMSFFHLTVASNGSGGGPGRSARSPPLPTR